MAGTRYSFWNIAPVELPVRQSPSPKDRIQELKYHNLRSATGTPQWKTAAGWRSGNKVRNKVELLLFALKN